ncbi:MAG: hypothetical protein ACE14O_04440 [Candidatus Cloacimonadaceae bacterium]
MKACKLINQAMPLFKEAAVESRKYDMAAIHPVARVAKRCSKFGTGLRISCSSRQNRN